jgi:uncharacterized protein with GYD domain
MSVVLIRPATGFWISDEPPPVYSRSPLYRQMPCRNRSAHRWRAPVAKYMLQVSYTQAGLKGLLKEGGSSRAATIKQLAKSQGGKLEAFYYAFGEDDVYVIVDLPGNVEASALSLTIGASGAVSCKTIVLLSPEDIDAAVKIKVSYRAPGA